MTDLTQTQLSTLITRLAEVEQVLAGAETLVAEYVEQLDTKGTQELWIASPLESIRFDILAPGRHKTAQLVERLLALQRKARAA